MTKTSRTKSSTNPIAKYLRTKPKGYIDVLAKKLRVSRQAIGYWMHGFPLPNVENSQRLEKETGIKYSALKAWAKANAS